MGVEQLPATSITILIDEEADVACLSVTIEGIEHDLGRYPTMNECAQAALTWMSDRHLTNASDTARRLDEAQRRDAKVFTFDVIRREE